MQNFLESFSSSCIDEVHNGKLVVDRKRAPLPDGSLQQLVDHSINKQVHRKDHERIPPVLSLSKPTKKKETIEQQTFEGRCRELGIKREAGLRLLQDSKREDSSQDFWGTLKTEPASEQRLETDTGKLDRSSTLTRRKTRGASAGLLEIRNALKGEQRKLARKKRKEDSKKARTSSSDEGEVCDSDEVIARQLQEDEERLQMFHAQLSVVKEDAEDVARQWAEATPAEENAAEKPNQYSSDHVAPLPPLKASKNPFLLRDRHLTRSNLNKVPGVKMTKLAPSSSLKEAAASESPPREKGERRVKSAQVGSRNVKGKAVAPTDWPRDRDLERMLHGKRKDIPPLPECPPLEFRKRTPEQAPVLTVNKSRNSDFGPSWTSPDTHFNLLSEAQLWMYGISIIKKTSGDEAGIYLKDASGERYPMHMVDKQFRIWVGFAHGDKVEKAEFIVDGGCPHHIVSDLDATRLRGGEGDIELVLGSFSKGQRHTLTGGNRWYVSLQNSVRNTFLDIFPSFYFHQETVLCHHRAHTLYHYHRRAALSLPASSGTCSTMAPAALSEEIEPRNALDSERRKQDSRERRTRNTFDLAVSWPVPHLWRRMREWQTESDSCAGVALGLPLDTKGPVTTPFVATLHAKWSLTYSCFRPKTFFSLFTD